MKANYLKLTYQRSKKIRLRPNLQKNKVIEEDFKTSYVRPKKIKISMMILLLCLIPIKLYLMPFMSVKITKLLRPNMKLIS